MDDLANKAPAPEGAVHIPARTIPIPDLLSPQARAALVLGAAREPQPRLAIDDLEGWRARVARVNGMIEPYVDILWKHPGLSLARCATAGVEVYVACRRDSGADERGKVHLHVHGGGWCYAGGKSTALTAGLAALHFGGTVHAVDYRTAPDHRFPAALDDCLAVYRELIGQQEPSQVLLSGESAGGNLAAALLLRARDEGLPMPAALFLNTPALDLVPTGDSWSVNLGLDVVLGTGPGGEADLYRNGADPRHPYVSPLFGDLRGFPPTYLRTGTRDLLLSDTVRMHAALRKAGVEADMYVGEAMPHGGFSILSGVDTPEDVDARADLARWLARHWPATSG